MPAIVVTVLSSAVTAQLSDSDRIGLVEELADAAKNLDPSLLPDLGTSKRLVTEQIDDVEQFLASRTTPEGREAWLKYLDVEPLRETIKSQGSDSTIRKTAVSLRYRLIGTAPGLEQPALLSLRDSVEGLISATRFSDKEKSTQAVAGLLRQLSQRINDLDDNPSSKDIAWITARVGLIDSSGQAKNAVASLRHTFNRPNLALLVGEPLLQQVMHQDVDRSRPVRDCILGTRILGTATMNGVLSAELLPTIGSARIQLSLAGHIVSHNTGYNGPVRLRSVSNADIYVSRTLHLEESGIRMEPAIARAEMTTNINQIEHRLALVRKIARKRAAQQKPQADRIAVRNVRSQISQEFTANTDEALSPSPSGPVSRIRTLLQRLSLCEPVPGWGSTGDLMSVNVTFRRPDQLSTVVPPPSVTVPYEAAIQVHESVINNICSPILAGRTLNEKQLNELLKEAGRPESTTSSEPTSVATAIGAEDDAPESDPPFEIVFAQVQPIVFEARDQTIRIGVRGTRFVKGRRELIEEMEITAVYHAKTIDGTTSLHREGDIDVIFPSGKRLNMKQAGLKPTIKKSFANVFPEVLMDRPLEIPSTTPIDQLKGRVFYPQSVDADGGWLTITIR